MALTIDELTFQVNGIISDVISKLNTQDEIDEFLMSIDSFGEEMFMGRKRGD